MSRKHYIAIAALVQHERNDAILSNQVESIDNLARSMSGVFSQDNPNFDRSRFLKACGVDA